MIITRRPEDVLDEHARVTARFMQPTDDLADYLRYFMQDAADEHDGQVSSMFYPVARTKSKVITHEQGRQLAKTIGDGLRFALTYEVAPEMTTAMRAVYTATMGKIEHLDEAEMPCDQGFAWLDDGWEIMDRRGEPIEVRALAWDRTSAMTDGTDTDKMEQPGIVHCARISIWSHKADDLRTGRDDAEHVRYVEDKLGTLTLTHTAVVPFGLRFIRPADTPRSVDSVIGIVHVLWMFLGMEIAGERREQVMPASKRKRRRLQSLRHHEVHVVLLRRIARETGAEPGHREIEWTCRWIVQGHYRHLVKPPPPLTSHRGLPSGPDKHCAACGGELAYVRAYLKGPDGKPLKVSRVLHKLAR